MVSEKARKNAGYLQILFRLKKMKDRKVITNEEYEKARAYYRQLTGADVVLAG